MYFHYFSSNKFEGRVKMLNPIFTNLYSTEDRFLSSNKPRRNINKFILTITIFIQIMFAFLIHQMTEKFGSKNVNHSAWLLQQDY